MVRLFDMSKLLWMMNKYSFKSYKSNKLLTALSLLSSMVSMILLLSILTIMSFNSQYVKSEATRMNGSDLNIVLNNGWLSNEEADMLNSLKDDGVNYVKINYEDGYVKSQNKTSKIVLRVYDFDNYNMTSFSSSKYEYTDDNSIVLSDNIAKRLDVNVGEEVSLYFDNSGDFETFVVYDIVPNDNDRIEDMHIFGYGLLNNKDNMYQVEENSADRILINLKDNSIDLDGYFENGVVTTPSDVIEKNMSETSLINYALLLISAFTLFMSSILLTYIMMIFIQNRRRDFIMLRIMGMKRLGLFLMISLELLVLMLVMYVISMAISVVLSNSYIQMNYSNTITDNSIYIVPFAIVFLVLLLLNIAITSFVIKVVGLKNVDSILRDNIKVNKIQGRSIELFIILSCIVALIITFMLKGLVGLYVLLGVLGFITVTYFTVDRLLMLIISISKKRINALSVVSSSMRNQRIKYNILIFSTVVGFLCFGLSSNIEKNLSQSLLDTIESQSGYNNIAISPYDNKEELDKYFSENNDILFYSEFIQGNVDIININNESFKMSEEVIYESLNDDTYLVDNINVGDTYSKSSEIVVSYNFSYDNNIEVGDVLNININGEVSDYVVSGILNQSIVNTAQIYFQYNPNIHVNSNAVSYYINVTEGTEDNFTDFIDNNFENTILINISSLMIEFNKIIQTQIYILRFVSIFSLLVSIMMILSLNVLNLVNRRNEILLHRVVGAKNYNIFKYSLIENGIIMIIALTVSIVLIQIMSLVILNLIFHIDYNIFKFDYATILILAGFVYFISSVFSLLKTRINDLFELLRQY